MRGLKDWEQPYVINTDKAGSYTTAIRELKKNGQLPEETEHRQIKYLNNIIEADHGKLKRLIKPTLGFKSLKTAYATIKGFEAMRTLKKKQEGFYRLQEGIKGEVRLVERCFYLGNTALADTMEILKSALEKEPLFLTLLQQYLQDLFFAKSSSFYSSSTFLSLKRRYFIFDYFPGTRSLGKKIEGRNQCELVFAMRANWTSLRNQVSTTYCIIVRLDLELDR